MKRLLTAVIAAIAVTSSSLTALAQGAIPDHCGTSMEGIEIGTHSLAKAVKQYSELFKKAGEQYGVDPNLLAAICMQESSGRNLSHREDGSEYPAWGIMQIEYTNEKSFAQFGERTTGTAWTLEDRLDPEKAVPYAAWLISESLYQYDCDYMKMIQGYNFGTYVLDKIIADKGDDWLEYRKDAALYVENWPYKTYGDAEYIEHVLRYYHDEIEYRGAKVRIDGELVEFEDQAPLIDDGRTMIPIRAVAQTLGAYAAWDGKNYQAIITKKGTTIKIPINSDIVYVDDEEVQLDCEAQIMNDRTMVPLRFIAETFGIEVDWDQETRTVMIEK